MDMRNPTLALTAALALGAGLLAQQPPVQPQPPANEALLKQILENWEQVMGNLNALVAECTRTEVNKTWQTTKVFEGKAKFLKPNMASLEMHNKANPQEFEKFIVNGQEVCVYAPKNKQIQVHKLPPPQPGQATDDNFLSFLMGMKAAQAVKRYQLTLLPSPPPTEKWYYYIQVVPRDAKDKADFTQARLVLTRDKYLPRQLWFEQPNGNEVTWDFNQLLTGGTIPASEFARPVPPVGWQLVPAEAPGGAGASPRVYRPQN
jgi:TIGR03009 family protein